MTHTTPKAFFVAFFSTLAVACGAPVDGPLDDTAEIADPFADELGDPVADNDDFELVEEGVDDVLNDADNDGFELVEGGFDPELVVGRERGEEIAVDDIFPEEFAEPEDGGVDTFFEINNADAEPLVELVEARIELRLTRFSVDGEVEARGQCDTILLLERRGALLTGEGECELDVPVVGSSIRVDIAADDRRSGVVWLPYPQFIGLGGDIEGGVLEAGFAREFDFGTVIDVWEGTLVAEMS